MEYTARVFESICKANNGHSRSQIPHDALYPHPTLSLACRLESSSLSIEDYRLKVFVASIPFGVHLTQNKIPGNISCQLISISAPRSNKSRLILYSLDPRTHRGRPSASRTHIPNHPWEENKDSQSRTIFSPTWYTNPRLPSQRLDGIKPRDREKRAAFQVLPLQGQK